MKNSPLKIFLLVLLVVLLLLPLQWLPDFTVGSYEVKRVALLSDVLPDSAAQAELPVLPALPADSGRSALTAASAGDPRSSARRDSCPKGVVCIEDYAGPEGQGMAPFYRALGRAKSLGRPVRVAYLGDSFIEVDILTSSLRRMLQQRFGGSGVGYLEMAPPYAANRATVTQRSGGWATHCLLDKGRYERQRLSLSGRYFLPQGTAWTEVRGVKQRGLDTAEVHTLYLRTSTQTEAGVKLGDGPMLALRAAGTGRIEALTQTGRAGKVRWQVPAGGGVTCWGVAEESRSGVVVDNYSLRGSSGTVLAEIPMQNLSELAAVRPYDLVVVQFGLNVANKKQLNYSHYAAQMKTVLEHLKQAFPNAGILLVGVGDREDRINGELRTLPGILALSRYQQNLAADCRVAFWNLFEGMGGEGSIRRMAEAKPAEAGKDYTHINMHGGERVAKALFKAIMHGYEQHR